MREYNINTAFGNVLVGSPYDMGTDEEIDLIFENLKNDIYCKFNDLQTSVNYIKQCDCDYTEFLVISGLKHYGFIILKNNINKKER